MEALQKAFDDSVAAGIQNAKEQIIAETLAATAQRETNIDKKQLTKDVLHSVHQHVAEYVNIKLAEHSDEVTERIERMVTARLADQYEDLTTRLDRQQGEVAQHINEQAEALTYRLEAGDDEAKGFAQASVRALQLELREVKAKLGEYEGLFKEIGDVITARLHRDKNKETTGKDAEKDAQKYAIMHGGLPGSSVTTTGDGDANVSNGTSETAVPETMKETDEQMTASVAKNVAKRALDDMKEGHDDDDENEGGAVNRPTKKGRKTYKPSRGSKARTAQRRGSMASSISAFDGDNTAPEVNVTSPNGSMQAAASPGNTRPQRSSKQRKDRDGMLAWDDINTQTMKEKSTKKG